MANFDGQTFATPPWSFGAPDIDGFSIYSVALGSGVNPNPSFLLAMHDDEGARHVWSARTPSSSTAPTLGAGSYVTETFAVLARF